MSDLRIFRFSRSCRMTVTEFAEFAIPDDIALPDGFDTWDGDAKVDWFLIQRGLFDTWRIEPEDTIDADMWTESCNA